MRNSKRLITLAATAALALGISAPAQAETVYQFNFVGRVTLSGSVCYPAPGGTCGATNRSMSSLSTIACASGYASTTKSPSAGVGVSPVPGNCTVSLVAGSVGASGVTGLGPVCGNSGGALIVDVTTAGKTVRVSLTYESAGSALALIGTTTKGNEQGLVTGPGFAVPDVSSAQSCTGGGASVFLVGASLSGAGLGAK